MDRLPFYPFDKGVDKFESIYVSVFTDTELDMFYIYRKIDTIFTKIIETMNESKWDVDDKFWFKEIKTRSHFTRKPIEIF
jgi:hypothetical protein